LKARVFFSHPVSGFAQPLGHMEAVNHRLAVGELDLARRQVSGAHVRPMGAYLTTLLLGKAVQAFLRRRLILAGLHCHDPWPARFGQVGEDGGIQFVPLLQTDFIEAYVGDLQARSDVLFVLELVGHDGGHHLRTDPQSPRHFFLGGADQHL
jgi:hypothetical protein